MVGADKPVFPEQWLFRANTVAFAYSYMWTRNKKKGIAKLHTAPEDNLNCELEENVAYVTAHNKLFSEAFFEAEEEEKKEEGKEEECEENSKSGDGKVIDLDPVSPALPCRQYLKEKEVRTYSRGFPLILESD